MLKQSFVESFIEDYNLIEQEAHNVRREYYEITGEDSAKHADKFKGIYYKELNELHFEGYEYWSFGGRQHHILELPVSYLYDPNWKNNLKKELQEKKEKEELEKKEKEERQKIEKEKDELEQFKKLRKKYSNDWSVEIKYDLIQYLTSLYKGKPVTRELRASMRDSIDHFIKNRISCGLNLPGTVNFEFDPNTHEFKLDFPY
jgi:signal recognition particle GTPase